MNLEVYDGTALITAIYFGRNEMVDKLLSLPQIAIRAMVRSSFYFLDSVSDREPVVQERMKQQIQKRIAEGEHPDSISMSPLQLAIILGENVIAFKIKKAMTKDQEIDCETKPTLFTVSTPIKILTPPPCAAKAELNHSYSTKQGPC